MWLWVVFAIVLGMLFANAAMAQQARPTYNPFNNGMMPQFNNGGYQQPFNNGFQNGYQRPFNNGFQNGYQQQYQRPQQQYQRPQQQYQQPQQQQQQQQLFTRTFYLNNGYLYGRPTLWYDTKTNKMQPWVRKNLR